MLVRPSDHTTMSVGVFAAPAEVARVPTLVEVPENCSSFDWQVVVMQVEAAADLVIAEVPAVGTAAGTPVVAAAEFVAVVVMKAMVEVLRRVSQSNRTLVVVVMIILKVAESSEGHHLNCGPSYLGQRTAMIGAVVMREVAVHCVVHRQASSSRDPCQAHCRTCLPNCRTCPSGQSQVMVRLVGVPLGPCRKALPMRRHRTQA